MLYLKIIDDHKKLHELGLDQILQENLGPEWIVEYHHARRSGKIERIYPNADDKDFFDFNLDDKVFIFWNYFWGNDHQDIEFQDQVKEKILLSIKQGAKIRMQLYTCYGTYSEDDYELDKYKKYFGKDIIIEPVMHIMHDANLLSDWAKRFVKSLAEYLQALSRL